MMAYSYTIENKENYLLVTLTGVAESLEGLKTFADDIMTTISSSHCMRALFDERDVEFRVDAHDAILFGEHLMNMDVQSMGYRVAVICSPKNRAISRAIETAFQNRSICYRVFEDVAAATEWIVS